MSQSKSRLSYESLYIKDDLESIQLEAARIVTGATKLVSHDKLYQEIGWLPLAKRRYIHKLILFYKIINGLTPNYLLSIVPSRNPGPQPNTRTRDNLPMLLCKTTLYYNSLFPSCIRAWNNLQRDLKDEPSVELFRQIIVKPFSSTYVPVFYYSGPRNLQIMHTRLRTQCSALNSHVFNKTVLTPPSVSAEVKKLANISYYIVLGTKTNDLKCSTHFASSWQIHRSWQ